MEGVGVVVGLSGGGVWKGRGILLRVRVQRGQTLIKIHDWDRAGGDGTLGY